MENTATPAPVTALTEFPQTEVGSLAALLPDTPWTTTVVQACERRTARAWVDEPNAPQAVAVLVAADPDTATPPTAYLFGSDSPTEALVSWLRSQHGTLDVVCDDDVGVHVYGQHPEAAVTEVAARWFERLDTVDRPEHTGVRRLRLRDVDAVAELGAPGILRSFETLKDLLMVGGASGIVEDGRVISAAFTVDQTVNYGRIVAYTLEERRGTGLATAACQHLVASHHEQGRLACALIEAGDVAGEALARAIGFERGARVNRYRID